MTDYDPRTATGIPTEPVGSLPRPNKLQEAYASYDAGTTSKEELEALQDEAVQDSLDRGAATGAPIISDGEQRWSSFATYPITDTLAGTGLVDTLSGEGGQFFAIFADGHGRQLPRLTHGPFKYKHYAVETLQKSLGMTSTPLKQAVIAPSMLALLYPLKDEISDYSREQFEPTSAMRPRLTSARPSRPVPLECRSTSPRAGWPPGPTRATPGPVLGCCRTSSN